MDRRARATFRLPKYDQAMGRSVHSVDTLPSGNVDLLLKIINGYLIDTAVAASAMHQTAKSLFLWFVLSDGTLLAA